MQTNGTDRVEAAIQILQVFFGIFTCVVEESGRLMIPPKLRLKSPYDTYQVLPWPVGAPRCLHVFPPWIWASFIDQLIAKPEALEDQESWQRALGGAGDNITLDKVGRVIIREDLLKKAGITKEATLVGRISTFEVWASERFAQEGKGNSQTASDLTQGIMIVKTVLRKET